MPAYLRCNSGHYFRPSAEVGAFCPLDGWTAPGFDAVQAAEDSLVADGEAPTIAGLRARGAPDDARRRTVVIEFGLDEATFEALSPEGFVIDGRFLGILDVPAALK